MKDIWWKFRFKDMMEYVENLVILIMKLKCLISKDRD